ncbi:hypothetical protein BO85DRAFT_477923 [Aspergillus piperis CBS 112811]|uniref:Uncharacterized protein n=1 Tax=Aspergillus piperis CBS 112811 TaxID=1448313 RepID=A0A8G1R2Q8_9EURO|nr:hypothetical protein BO85DRAFT_477923 [Aspergillus piperis CBS 112811]RAH57432.1 hypothetical protein BO85DRAFT_477923 [Aspergillus piperis CBS 112811]
MTREYPCDIKPSTKPSPTHLSFNNPPSTTSPLIHSNSMKSSNKPRLYISLHARGGGVRPKMPDKEDTYHWSLTILPKDKQQHRFPKTKRSIVGTTYHVRELPTPTGTGMVFKWTFEERSTALDTMVLVRVLIGKVVDRERLVEILREVPVGGGEEEGGEEGWNCVSWVRGAVEAIKRDDENGNEVLGKGRGWG